VNGDTLGADWQPSRTILVHLLAAHGSSWLSPMKGKSGWGCSCELGRGRFQLPLVWWVRAGGVELGIWMGRAGDGESWWRALASATLCGAARPSAKSPELMDLSFS
jgi:hypothetical protein